MMIRKILFSILVTFTVTSLYAFPSIEASLKRGRSFYECGRWSDARNAFEEAKRSLTPDAVVQLEECDYYLMACAVELGAESAEGMLLGFMERYPHSTYMNRVRFALGSHYCAEGDMKQARRYFMECRYRSLSRIEQERYDVRMGYVEFSEQRYGEAYNYFARLEPSSELYPHATYYRAYIDYLQGQLPRAKQLFTELQSNATYGPLAPYYLLQIEFREGNYRYVVEHGEALAAAAVPERRAELERVIAESWFRLDDYNRTNQHLNAFEAAGGKLDRDGAYLRGFSLYRLTRYEEAIPHLRAACGAEDALTQNASYHLADCYLRQGDKASAQQAFAMATNARFDATIAEDALFNCAKLQYELGGGIFNGAINLLTRYLKSYPRSKRSAEARTLLVAAYYNSRNYDAAYTAIKSLPAPDAELRTALQKIAYFRGVEAFAGGDYTTASESLQEAAAVNVSPRYTALSRFWQGEIAYIEGDNQTAISRYKNFLSRAPRTEREYPLAHYNLGYCFLSENDTEEAGRMFEAFLKNYAAQDSYRGDAINRLGDVAYVTRDFSSAVARYEESMSQGGPTRHYAAYKRAITLGILGRAAQKEQALRNILSEGKGNYLEQASYELGRTCIAQEKYSEGARQLEAFVADYPSSPRVAQAWADLGLAYLNMGDKRGSLEAYNRVISSAPQSAEAREALQGVRDIYVSEGNVEGYFAYAAKAGLESDLTLIARDSLSFAAAQTLYLAENRRTEAARSLRSYLKSYPSGAYRTDALYLLSTCYLQDKNEKDAITTLTELTSEGQNQYTLEALKQLADLTWRNKRYDEAAQTYRKLYEVTTSPSDHEAAMTGYVRATLLADEPTKIPEMASYVLACNDAGEEAHREARFAWAEQLREAGQMSEAYAHYERLDSEVKTTAGSAATYYLIERDWANGTGDKRAVERAIFAYAERSPKAYYLAKAYLLLGDLYLSEGDAFQARATYQSIVDGYSPADDGIIEEAQRRIKAIPEL